MPHRSEVEASLQRLGWSRPSHQVIGAIGCGYVRLALVGTSWSVSPESQPATHRRVEGRRLFLAKARKESG